MTPCTTLSKIVQTCIPEIQTDFLLWSITNSLSTGKSNGSSPKSLMKTACTTIISNSLEDSGVAQKVKEILKTYPIDLRYIHYLEKYPMLLSNALNLSFPEKDGALGIEIYSEFCHLISGNIILATVSSVDFAWPTYFVNFAFYKKLTDFQVSIMESSFESKPEKCRRFIEHLKLQCDNSTFCQDSCTLNCYSRREFYYSGSYGSHVFFSRISSRAGAVWNHERTEEADASF